jgi:class 3 adenylate cyclase
VKGPAHVNRFYRGATQTLVQHDAVIDKLIGGEVMAFFVRGTPQRTLTIRGREQPVDAFVLTR